MSIKHLYEDERPSLLLDFANSKTLDPRITFERLSVGTYVDEAGIIKTAVDNEARFGHDPLTGECRGLLIEEERTNNIERSTDFTTYWFKYNVTIDPNVATAPDGTTTASKMQWSSSSNRNMVFVQPTTDVTKTYTCSFYAKADEWNFAAVAIQPPGGGQPRYWITVDLTTGDVEEYSSGSPTQTDYDVTPLPNGWWRVSATANVDSAGKTQVQMEVGMSPNNTFGGSVSGTPDGTSGIYIWGAQQEEGRFITSYIPTSGSTYTRVPDEASITGTNFSNWFNQPSGTFMVEGELTNFSNYSTTNDQRLIHFEGDAAYKRYVIEILQNSSTVRVQSKKNTGSPTYSATYTSPKNKIAFAYEFQNNASAADGSLGTSAYNAGLTQPLALYIGNSSGTTVIGQVYFSKFSYYNTRLSDTTLEALTK